MVIEVGPGGSVKTQERTSMPVFKAPTADACTQTERPLQTLPAAFKTESGASILLVHFKS